MENGGDPEHFTDGQAEKDRYHKINWKRSPLITCMHTYTGWPALPNATPVSYTHLTLPTIA